jgi:hypothetical protein
VPRGGAEVPAPALNLRWADQKQDLNGSVFRFWPLGTLGPCTLDLPAENPARDPAFCNVGLLSNRIRNGPGVPGNLAHQPGRTKHAMLYLAIEVLHRGCPTILERTQQINMWGALQWTLTVRCHVQTPHVQIAYTCHYLPSKHD